MSDNKDKIRVIVSSKGNNEVEEHLYRGHCIDLLNAYATKYFASEGVFIFNMRHNENLECFEDCGMFAELQNKRDASDAARALAVIIDFPFRGKKKASKLNSDLGKLIALGWETVMLISDDVYPALDFLDDHVVLDSDLVLRTVEIEREIRLRKSHSGDKYLQISNRATDTATSLGAIASTAILSNQINKTAKMSEKVREYSIYVKLFGGFKIFKNGVAQNDKLWTKSKARNILALLVIRNGKDVSKDELLDIMWPELDYKRAQDNLYVTWASIKRALKLEDETCPYLRRSSNMYSINPMCVSSDISQLEFLAKKILMGNMNDQSMEKSFMRLEEIYDGDILAGNIISEHLERMNERYRDIIVDTYIFATDYLLEKGNCSAALWYARKAQIINNNREDAYRSLMKAQNASGQRTSAVETYFKCKNYLNEEFGLSLSRKTIELYESLINGD